MNSPKRVLFSANDPGGADAILPVVKKLLERGSICRGLLSGPACEIFRRRDISFTEAEEMSDADLKDYVETFKPDIFLAGRSFDFTIDKRIGLLLKEKKVPTLYVLDFWKDYWERFCDSGKDFTYLPDAVCVMDDLARKEMLEQGFPPDVIRVTGNPHFEHFTEGITSRHENHHEILFISQPVREIDGARYGFDEYTALASIIRAVQTLPETYKLHVRLHPKEDSRKYDAYVNARVSVSDARTLEEGISKAGLVIGMFSPVLIQATMAGKCVISYEPGLVALDPLPTNRLGVTRKISDEKELKDVLSAYIVGRFMGTPFDVSAMWPKGAAERIIAVIDELAR